MVGERVEVAPVLADIGRVNMLFALEAGPPGPGWRALSGAGPKEAAAEVERVRERLAGFAAVPAGAVEWRVAASLFQQGLATRLLSPVLAAALCHGAALRARDFHRDPGAAGAPVLRTSQRWATPVCREPAAVAAHLAESVLAGVLEPVAAALRAAGARGRVAPGLLRGNTASALAGAARSLGADRPAVRERAREVVRLLTSAPPLAGTGSYTGRDAGGAAVFRRTTCCLYYRVPGSGYCGDCALTAPGRGPGA
ncbi:Ferric iron reductase protein FhuF, involved in iron transport [Nocardiopsis flavescens]|uniref:Ferric iron reductase protein FhuF, involved in iron transport n=1 Tax=Nocardiopsis flavescens TaxID=758803 RepID=A0A1M6AZ45_9ACTN|nr:(2Fe-2S)-binding protein [Nocardiopsis flavescens]SHI41779.1 Ferric iron reductase protein FhuF, involved in iron transport [Nocardiopsis flavescens]